MDFTVVADNLTYFMIGRYPHGELGGVALTLLLAGVSCVFALVGGVVLGVLSYVPFKPLQWLVRGYTHVMRGVPLLMVIFWMYFLLPLAFGQPVPEYWTVVAALTLFTSAYMAHIVRAGIDAVPRGQREAALASGLSPAQAMAWVVLPQGLRHMIPSFVNELVALTKDTSLAFIVGVSELTHIATQVNNRELVHPAEIFLFVAAVYFVICFSLSQLSRWLEQRMGWGQRAG
jgi:polar amino acid transport system permease protein